jgi:hypothetical protein
VVKTTEVPSEPILADFELASCVSHLGAVAAVPVVCAGSPPSWGSHRPRGGSQRFVRTLRSSRVEFESFEKCELVGEFGVRGKGQTSWSENSTIRGAARSSLRKSEVRGESLMLVGKSEVREDTQKFVGRA